MIGRVLDFHWIKQSQFQWLFFLYYFCSGNGSRTLACTDSNPSANMTTSHSGSGDPNALHRSQRGSILTTGSIKDAGCLNKIHY